MALLDHVTVPIASETDATATAESLAPYVTEIDRITAVHVVEKGGGSIDKAPMEKRREDGQAALAVLEDALGDEVTVETRIEYHTSVIDAIEETARDIDATAIAFRPRGGSRILRLLSGDTTTKLVTEPSQPVISLPTPEGTDHE